MAMRQGGAAEETSSAVDEVIQETIHVGTEEVQDEPDSGFILERTEETAQPAGEEAVAMASPATSEEVHPEPAVISADRAPTLTEEATALSATPDLVSLGAEELKAYLLEKSAQGLVAHEVYKLLTQIDKAKDAVMAFERLSDGDGGKSDSLPEMILFRPFAEIFRLLYPKEEKRPKRRNPYA